MHLCEMPDIQRVLGLRPAPKPKTQNPNHPQGSIRVRLMVGREWRNMGYGYRDESHKDYMSYSLSTKRGAYMSNYIGEHHRDY